jgi:CheY-like chemotaxis protein
MKVRASLSDPNLQGLQVLVVEDEALVAMMLEDLLRELGCVLVSAASSVGQALSQLAVIPALDAAILDVHLGNEVVFPVADLLVRRKVPFVFSTGYGPTDLAQRYPASRYLAKPFDVEALARVLADLPAAC